MKIKKTVLLWTHPSHKNKSGYCILAGLIELISLNGFKYTPCFVNDYSGQIMVYFLKQKHDTFLTTKKCLADHTV